MVQTVCDKNVTKFLSLGSSDPQLLLVDTCFPLEKIQKLTSACGPSNHSFIWRLLQIDKKIQKINA